MTGSDTSQYGFDIDDYRRMLGQVLMSWSGLEHAVDLCIWEAASVQRELAACLTGNIGSLYAKMKTLSALAELKDFPPELISEIKNMRGRLQELSEERDRLIHDSRFTRVDIEAGAHGSSSLQAGEVARSRVDSDRDRESGPKSVAMDEMETLCRRIKRRAEAVRSIFERITALQPRSPD